MNTHTTTSTNVIGILMIHAGREYAHKTIKEPTITEANLETESITEPKNQKLNT